MAAGDIYQVGPTSVNAAASLQLKPSGTNEASVHNIYFEGAVEIYYGDAGHLILLESFPGADSLRGEQIHVGSTHWVEVKNVSGGAFFIAADGFQTKT